MKTPEEKVTETAACLDIYGPKDWANQINLLELDLTHNENCVFGQLYGHIKKAPEIFKDCPVLAIAPFPFGKSYGRTWQAWKKEIELRRGKTSFIFPPEWVNEQKYARV